MPGPAPPTNTSRVRLIALAALPGLLVFQWLWSCSATSGGGPDPTLTNPQQVARRAQIRGWATGERPVNFAHRGASAYQAEHSLTAFRTALTQGADILEIDLHRTNDGHLIILHDESLERTTGQDQLARDLSLAAIQAIDPGILTLPALFAAFPTTPINIEIKQKEPSIAADLAQAIRTANREASVIVSSGSGTAIAEFRAASGGQIATGAALGEVLGFYFDYLFGFEVEADLPFDALQVPAFSLAGVDLSTPEFISFAQSHGLLLHFWTIDERAEMDRLIAAGADGIMTNRPDLLRAAIQAYDPNAPQDVSQDEP